MADGELKKSLERAQTYVDGIHRKLLSATWSKQSLQRRFRVNCCPELCIINCPRYEFGEKMVKYLSIHPKCSEKVPKLFIK